MAYTTPPTFNVGDVLTAAQMNAYVRDNVAYLKGSAGTIAFDSGITVAGTLTTTDTLQVNKATPDSQAYLSSSGPRIALGNNATYASRTLSARWVMATANGQFGLTTAGDSWLFTEGIGGGTAGRLILGANSNNNQLTLATNGNIGMGVASPQLPLHVSGGGAGFCGQWSNATTITTAQTILPASSVTVGIVAIGMIKWSGSTGIWAANIIPNTGTNPMLSGGAAVSGSCFLYSDSTPNTCTLAVAANGSVTIARTAGTGSYDVSLMLFWR